MKLATKRYWRQYNSELWREIVNNSNIDRSILIRVQKHPYGQYETPKTYDETGVAYNDGTWLIYSTCRRCVGGNLRVKIHCKNKNELIRHIYGYIIFLRLCGIEKYEARIYVVRYIIYKLTFDEGMFDCNAENKKLIAAKIMAIYKKDIGHYSTTRVDERRYAIDPKVLRGKSIGERTQLHNRIEGKLTKDILDAHYNPEVSIRKNVIALKELGYEISKSTIGRWLKIRSP